MQVAWVGMGQSEEDFTETRERKPLKTKAPTVCKSDGESIVPVRQTRKLRAHKLGHLLVVTNLPRGSSRMHLLIQIGRALPI